MRRFSKGELFWRRRVLARLVRAWSKRRHHPGRAEISDRRSDLKIDLFTPLVPKDLDIFPTCVGNARKFLQHPIGNHYVCGPDLPEIRAACDELGCRFVPELEVLGFGVDKVAGHWPEKDKRRGGWLFQQLLKLSADTVVENDAVLVLDADTFFVSNVVLEHEGRFIFQYTDGYMECYDESTRRLLGRNRLSSFSFVCHHMLFRREVLVALRADIETRFGKTWYDTIIDHVPPGDWEPFSEFELYGNFALRREPEKHELEYWFNVAGVYHENMDLNALTAEMGPTKRTVSLHHHARKS